MALSEPMFDTVCTLPLSADLFAQAVHPTEPLVAVGLSSGHVAVLKLPPVDSNTIAPSSTSQGRRGSNGTDLVETVWRTKRHKGSCRCLAYSVDGGRQLYSAGTDGIVKAADCETGRVVGKVAIPSDPASSRRGVEVDAPTVIHALSPQTLLLATDSGALHLYDLRDPAPSLPLSSDNVKTAFINATPAQTHHPHPDYISSLCPLPPTTASTSGYSKQWLTTGGTTLALTDLRRGVLVQSEDQAEILLSSLYVSGLSAKGTSSGEKALVGAGDGVITLWEKGRWNDQDQRIVVSKEKETVDVMVNIPDGVGGAGKQVAVGLGEGVVRVVRLGMNKVVAEMRHDDVEGVVGLGFDVGGRMVSGGGQVVKVWGEKIEVDAGAEDDEEADAGVLKREADSDDEYDQDDDEDPQSEEDQTLRKHRKKRKRGKGPAAGSGMDFAGLD